MSVVINTNYSATVAANNLSASNAMLQTSLNRLSSGSRIVNPSDDAGGLAVSMKLSAAAVRSGAAINNVGNATSFLQAQDGVLKVAGAVLQRVSELSTLYTDPTKNASDKANYDAEFTQLQSELTSLASEKFNSVSLFSTSSLTVGTSEDGLQTVSMAGRNLTATGTGGGVGDITATLIGTLNASASGTTAGSTGVALSTITTAISNIATMRASNGAEQSRLGFASQVLTVNKANLEAANSRITDVDVATESTHLARWNILVQSGTAMLSQANQSAQVALKLIG